MRWVWGPYLSGAVVTVVSPFHAAAAIAAPATIQIVSQAPATQAGAERFVLHSQRVGRDFLVEVTAPITPILPGQKLPVIYALDSGYGIAGPVGRVLSGPGGMAPAFVVSVGYPDGQPNKRNDDLAHHSFRGEDGATVGGGAAFEAFLIDELRPFIEARYPADPDQAILFGHSLGGLFAANVLADRPEAFRAYLIGSPSVWADPALLGHVAAAASRGGGRRVFVGVGGKETAQMLDGTAQLAAVLSKPPSTFVVKAQVFEGQVHMSYYPQLAPIAFAYVLPGRPLPPERHEIAVDPRLFDRYVGVYHLADGRLATVVRRDDKLFGQLTDFPEVQLWPETPTAFFVKGFDAQMTFQGEADRPADSLVMRLNGSEATAKRGATP
jgi:predicted alpha/beta superfamily hydrolase